MTMARARLSIIIIFLIDGAEVVYILSNSKRADIFFIPVYICFNLYNNITTLETENNEHRHAWTLSSNGEKICNTAVQINSRDDLQYYRCFFVLKLRV